MARRRSTLAQPSDADELAAIQAFYRRRLTAPAARPQLKWAPVYIGPTWQLDGDRWLLPERTLGWEMLAWCGRWLQHGAGRPWVFTDEQARFLLHWYALEADGTFTWVDGVLQRLKGWGKDPIGAALCAFELLGPARLADWVGDQPVGRPVTDPWVQTAAVSLEQTKNTMRLLPSLFSAEAITHYRVQLGKETVYALGGSAFMQAVTSAPATLEGARGSFILPNEALALGVRIPTPEGWSTVRDVAVGDRIIGSDGPTTVTHVTPVYEGRPCFRVTFEDGSELDADEGHLWFTRVNASAAGPKVRTTREMFEDTRSFAVPRPAPFDAPDLRLPLDPYVLGAWLGDGATQWASLTVGDEDLEHFLAEVQARGVPAARVRKRYPGKAAQVSLMGNREGRLYTKDGSSVRGALVKLGVLGDKHVPGDLLRASRAQRLELLRGLMDTDGCCTADGSAIFVSSNGRLFDGVVELVRSLGYTAHIRSVTDTRWPGDPVSHRLSFRPDPDLNPFLLARKAARVKATAGRRWKSVRSIVPVESTPVKCIEVDADDHLFIAGEGWTLTHNTQHWLANNAGHDMADVLERNAAKSADGAARALRITNAFEPGLDSVAERDRDAYEAVQDGRAQPVGLLYDSVEAPPEAPLTAEAAPSVVEAVRGDSTWLSTERIVKSIQDTRNPPSRSRRFWYNQITAREDAWAQPADIMRAVRDDVVIGAREPVVAFFDGSKSDDSTGLVICRLTDGHAAVRGIWQQPAGPRGKGWIVPRDEVDAAVHAMFREHRVAAFWADPSDTRDDVGERFWEPLIDEWHRRYGRKLAAWPVQTGPRRHSVAWDMREHAHVREFTFAAMRTVNELESGQVSYDRNQALLTHLRNARRRPNPHGVSMAKEHRESTRKVDLAVCLVGARMLRRVVLNKDADRRRGRVV